MIAPQKRTVFEIDEVGLPVFRGNPDAPAAHMDISEILALEQSTLDEDDRQRYMPQSLDGLVEALANLNQQALRAFAPIVEDIVRSRSRDTQHIEHTLDGLLGFCGYTPTLNLYKKLCRYYWKIDPIATARYIDAYRDAWDSDETGPADAEVNP